MGLLNPDDPHSSSAFDPANFILIYKDHMAGFYMAWLCSRGYRPLTFENYKKNVIRLRVRRNLLAVLQADEYGIEPWGFEEILFDVAFG